MPVRMSLGTQTIMHINDAILEEVLAVAPCSRSLHFPPLYDTPLSLVRQLAQARLDRLEDLSLGSMDRDWPDPPPSFTDPCLRKLSISYCLTTDLTFGSPSPEVTLGILSHCANLLTVAPGWPGSPKPTRISLSLAICTHCASLLLCRRNLSRHFLTISQRPC
ncbi:hypothetical protein C8R45DRAFT_1021005 [Mycena sanguinolenta]|nr:hypothetical protein C8R45DRAFT_1021005 [Mycena sanguinolenta]